MSGEDVAVRLAMVVLKDAIYRLPIRHPSGLGNSAIARELGLESDHEERRVRKTKAASGSHNVYIAVS